MKYTFIIIGFFITQFSIAQAIEHSVIDQKIKAFFDDFHQKDSTKLKTYFEGTATLQSVIKTKEGTTKVVDESISKFISSIGSIPDSIHFEERIFKATITIDKRLAHAFVPYQFYVNEKLSHCGVNSFIFALVEDRWLISNIIDTRTRDECDNSSN